MHAIRIWLALTVLTATCPAAQAQFEGQLDDEVTKFGTPQYPPSFRLHSLTQVKLGSSNGKPVLIFMLEGYREEERVGNFTTFRTETRTRMVTVIQDGEEKQVEQTYQVQVPVTKQGEHKVLVRAGKKPLVVAWDKARVYRLDGSLVKPDEAEKALGQLTTVFLLDDIDSEVRPTSEVVQQVLRPETLIIATGEIAMRRPQGQAIVDPK